MARKPRVFIQGGIYHITSRGNDRQNVFRTERDRLRFLERLKESALMYNVRVYMYCLMSNHIHLLIETPQGNLNRFMGSLLTGYTSYFNRCHSRAGHLMQGRYGAQVVEGSDYLLRLSRYIHLNPVHVHEWSDQPLEDQLHFLRNYAWSSYPEYAGLSLPCDWLCTEPVLSLVDGLSSHNPCTRYQRYVEAGLTETDEEFAALMRDKGVAIGSEPFIEEMKQRHQKAADDRRKEDISFRQILTFRTVAEVREGVEQVLGTSADFWMIRRKGALKRGCYAWALQHYAGLTQRETAPHIGVETGAAVCQSTKRFIANESCALWREHLNLIFKG